METAFRDSNILVGIYLEAEDFEYFRKFRKKERSTFVANAIEHYREKYPNPVFLIRCNNYVWGLKRFKPELEEYLIDKTKKEKLRDLNIHFPDKGKIWRYVEDFALILTTEISFDDSSCGLSSAIIRFGGFTDRPLLVFFELIFL